ncbi:transmembrane protein 180 [Octopus bimaculoides]|uniref:Transmembrane protein 180 n=1 Tax=Octopus bimaculoides TaxID=37653 RepID=A0A0L8G0Y6_OCTBM|nr:transmembrane protein 180 [Octopus bimaculoides]XP_052824290.1 transmembrane protein 180 [Octopus bimaculoides]XP_052824291.1 transmembrane protein 180 [Octopus bimaculoides]XP_052824293.1 transmembrane protein 180 [Octopus bimaculoides]|eukprot:XP_014785056.1 PREDICTED: transmembrane protein 180-like [Octopus bimaculoides]
MDPPVETRYRSLWKRISSYALTSFAFSFLNSIFQFYYVKIFLNIYHIEESWFHIAQVVFMIWNAINDPLFAYIQDMSGYSFVRSRRETILYAAPFLSLAFLIPWFPWSFGTWLTGIHLIMSLCLYDTAFTYIGLAHCCLSTEMSHVHKDRLQLIQFAELACLFGGTSVFFCEYFTQSLKNFANFQILCFIIACISCLCMRYTGKNAYTEYDIASSDNCCGESKKSSESITIILRQLFTNRNFITFVLVNFFQVFHKTFISNFMAIFIDQLLPDTTISTFTRSTYYGAINLLPQILVILCAPLVAKVGYYYVTLGNYIFKILFGVLMCLVGPSYPLLFLMFLLADSSYTCATYSLINMPLSDVADENAATYKRPKPISSMIFGMSALIEKPAISISPMFIVNILNSYGYQQLKDGKLSLSKTNILKSTMFNLIYIIPICMGCVQLVIWSLFRLRHTHKNSGLGKS